MSKIKIIFIITIILSIFNIGFASPIPNVPTENIYIQDYANILKDDTKKEINQIGKEIYKTAKSQIVVVTIPTLDGVDIKDYSINLFRKWKIGDKDTNKGMLILIVSNDRNMRFEVGYGLEGDFPDGKVGRYRDTLLTPLLKENKYDEGLLLTYKTIAEELNVKMVNGKKDNKQKKAEESLFFNILFVVIMLVIFLAILNKRSRSNHNSNYFMFFGNNNDGGNGGGSDTFGGGDGGGGGADGGF